MITVNQEQREHRSGATVTSLLEEMGFIFPLLVVRINEQLVDRANYAETPVADGDTVDVLHLISGG